MDQEEDEEEEKQFSCNVLCSLHMVLLLDQSSASYSYVAERLFFVRGDRFFHCDVYVW